MFTLGSAVDKTLMKVNAKNNHQKYWYVCLMGISFWNYFIILQRISEQAQSNEKWMVKNIFL